MFLERIVEQTRQDLLHKKVEHPIRALASQAAAQSQPRDLFKALKKDQQVQLIAEVKRASPSKGMLAEHLAPVETACAYEQNKAAAISVLTEPHFFLGSPDYLTAIKQAVQIPVLRKDFIVDPYQVYEARAWGADALLLICAILDDEQLRTLLELTHRLGMQALVEIHSQEEARRAIRAGANIIGVNSRDLVTFQMNPYLLREIRHTLPSDRVIVAESGIHNEADARRLARYDVQAMLVGESLVVSNDIPGQIHTLLNGANGSTQVKICGLKTSSAIDSAIEAGADMLGFIFHETSHRYVTPEQVCMLLKESQLYQMPPKGLTRPDLVGVFVNKDADFINAIANQIGLDYVQLHGNENPELCQAIQRPVIKALALKDHHDLARLQRYKNVAWRILIDTPGQDWGGSGIRSDWQLANLASKECPTILAGGLTTENVSAAIATVHPWGVDVSSGVETEKQKDHQKILSFIAQVRQAAQIDQELEEYYTPSPS